MSDGVSRREYAALQAHNWAKVASDLKSVKRILDPSSPHVGRVAPADAAEFGLWVVANLHPRETLTQDSAREMALMWARVAEVQPDTTA